MACANFPSFIQKPTTCHPPGVLSLILLTGTEIFILLNFLYYFHKILAGSHAEPLRPKIATMRRCQ